MPNKLIDIINITKSYDENVILDQLRLPIPVISFLMEKISTICRQTADS